MVLGGFVSRLGYTRPSVFDGAGVLWVLTGTHQCDAPSKQDAGDIRTPTLCGWCCHDRHCTSACRLRHGNTTNTTSIVFLRCCKRKCPRPEPFLQRSSLAHRSADTRRRGQRREDKVRMVGSSVTSKTCFERNRLCGKRVSTIQHYKISTASGMLMISFTFKKNASFTYD